MQRVTILGLGLIGGSIGLGLRRWSEQNRGDGQPALGVTGFDTDLAQQQYAQKIKAIDRGAWNLAKAVEEADLIVVATPVGAMAELFADIAPRLREGCVVTDVGSTKAEVLAQARQHLPRSVSFVGGHPMAGKSQSIEAADAELFKGATWCVTPAVTASEEAIRTVLGMIAALGAEPYFVDPAEHDGFVAGTSHLPTALSAALVNTVSRDSSWRDMKTLTAGGFRDMSRLAAGSPVMHRDLLWANRAAVTRWLDTYQERLSELRQLLQTRSDTAPDNLLAYLTEARDARADWATQTTREGELLQQTGSELMPEGIGDQMGRMFLGGLGRRRRSIMERGERIRSSGGDDDRGNGRSARH